VLILIVVSLSLILGSISLGSHIARLIGLSFEEVTDDLFASFWLGYSLFLLASLTAVAFAPLRTITLPVAILIAILVIDSLRRLGRRIGAASPAGAFVTVLIIVLVAWAACQPSRLYDSGAYHYQIIAWYRAYGAVPGVALLNHHLGLTSSLFALTAIAEGGPLLAGIGNVVNASAVLVSLLFAANKMFSAYRGDTRPSVLYWPLCTIVVSPMFGLSLFSTSPDVLVYLFVMAFGWFALTCESFAGLAGSWKSAVFIVMAAGAYSVKSSGLALVAVSLLLSCLIYWKMWSRLALIALLSVILVVPVCCVNTITSGYPLFPMLPLRLPVPWALSLETAKAVKDSITNFPFVYQSHGAVPVTLSAKLAHLFWVDNSSLFSLGILDALGFAFLVKTFGLTRKVWPLSIATAEVLLFSGITLALQVPATRFLLGYLAVVPVLGLAHLRERWLTGAFASCLLIWSVQPWQYLNRLDIVRLFVFGAVLLTLMFLPKRGVTFSGLCALCLCCFQYMRPLMSAGQMARTSIREPRDLLAPPAPRSLANGEFIWVKHGEVITRAPVAVETPDQCWATEPPCAPADANFGTVKGLRYRKLGALGSGFVQSD